MARSPWSTRMTRVATEELRYGDNDRLSARVAQMIQSDLLILLSDVDGVYTADPRRDRERAACAASSRLITEEIEALGRRRTAAGVGSGGMRTKLAAARIAQQFRLRDHHRLGPRAHPLARSSSGEASRDGDRRSRARPARAYKQWIAGTLVAARAALMVDAGAARALAGGKSLLPAGMRAVDGEFERGVCLRVLGPDGREIARGIIAYTSAKRMRSLGRASSEIESRLGYIGPRRADPSRRSGADVSLASEMEEMGQHGARRRRPSCARLPAEQRSDGDPRDGGAYPRAERRRDPRRQCAGRRRRDRDDRSAEAHEERLEAIATALDAIAALPDPVGDESWTRWTRPNGLDIARVRTPIGVIGMIYESRPNVTADAAAICLRSGNAVILRSGSEALRSALAIGSRDCRRAWRKAACRRAASRSCRRRTATPSA